MTFNVEGALKAGYTQEQIDAYIQQKNNALDPVEASSEPVEEVTEEVTKEVISTPKAQPPPEPAQKAFNVEGALKAGYTQEQIDRYQQKRKTFNYDGAVKAGYTPAQIDAHLAGITQPVEEESSWFDKYVLDTAISTTQGVVGLAEAGVGLLDIPTMGYAGKGLEWAQNEIFGGDTQDLNAWLQKFKTPEQLTAEKELEDVKGFLPTIKELATNPAALTNMVFQTLPQMAGGWGIARKLLTEAGKRGSKKLTELAAKELYKKNAIRAAAAGEGAIAAGAAAEGIRQQTEDGLLSPKQAAMSVATGVGTAVLGIAGGKAAQKLGIADVDVLMTGGRTAAQKTAQTKSKSALVEGIKGAIAEGTLEELPQSIQEQMAMNIALGRPYMEGVAEAAAEGMVAGFAVAGPITGVSQAAQNRAIKAADVEAENKKLDDLEKEDDKNNPSPKKVKDEDYKDIENVIKAEEAELQQRTLDLENKTKAAEQKKEVIASNGVINETVLTSWGIRPNSNPWKNLLNVDLKTPAGVTRLNEELSKYKGKMNEKAIQKYIQGAKNVTPSELNAKTNRDGNAVPDGRTDANAARNQDPNRPGANVDSNDTGKAPRRKSRKQLALEAKRKDAADKQAQIKAAIKQNVPPKTVQGTTTDLDDDYDDETNDIIRDLTGNPEADFYEESSTVVDEPTRRKNLNRWGGASLATRNPETNELITFYHATSETEDGREFTNFKPGVGNAIYASPSSEEAQMIGLKQTAEAAARGERYPEGSRVIPVKIRAENVWDYDNQDDVNFVTEEIQKRKGKDEADLFLKGVRESDYRLIESQTDIMQDLGFDGFYIMEPTTSGLYSKNIGVFNPDQLKSATGNMGTFEEGTTLDRAEDFIDGETVVDIDVIEPDVFNSAVKYLQQWVQSIPLTNNIDISYTKRLNSGTVPPINLVNSVIRNLFGTGALQVITEGGLDQVPVKSQLIKLTAAWSNIKASVEAIRKANGAQTEVPGWNDNAAGAIDAVLDQLSRDPTIDAKQINAKLAAYEMLTTLIAALNRSPAIVKIQRSMGGSTSSRAISNDWSHIPEFYDFIEQNGSLNVQQAIDIILDKIGTDLVVADERAILRLLKKVPNLDDVLINFDMASAVNGSNFNGAMRLSVGGYYDESTRTLSLNPMVDTTMDSILQRPSTIIHEFIHAATVGQLQNEFKDPKVNLKDLKPTTALGAELKRIALAAQKNANNPNQYGFNNINEFLAEAFSNKDFQNTLAMIPGIKPAVKDSLWNDFVNFVNKTLKALTGVTALPQNLLNDLVAVSPALFKGPQSNQSKKSRGSLDLMETDYEAEGDKLLKKSGQQPAGKKPPNKPPTYNIPGDDPRYDNVFGRIGGLLRWIQTKVFSFDAALNNAILKSMRKQGVTAEDFRKGFYMLDAGQAVKADDVATNFIFNGSIKWDENTGKASVEESGMSMKDLEEKLLELSRKKNVPLDKLIEQAHAYFVSKRNQGIRSNNLKVRRQVLKLLRQGKQSAAKKVHKLGFKVPNMTLKEQQEGLKLIKLYPELAEIGNIWTNVRTEVLKFAVDSGLYNKEQAEKLLDVMDYVPFYREIGRQGVGPQSSTRGLLDGQTDKAYKGSYRPVHNVFDNMEKWAHYIVRKGVQNQAAVNKILLTQKYMGNEIAEGTDENKDKGIRITVWIDGDKQSFQYKSKIFSEAFTGLEPAAIPLLRYFAPVINFLRLNIVLNPIFSIIQIPMDAFATFLTSGVKLPVMLPLQVIKELALTTVGMSSARKALKKSTVAGIRDYSKQVEQVEKEIRNKTYGQSINTFDKILKALVSPLQKFSQISDNVIRQAVYAQTMLETSDAKLATMRAAEIINFRRTGSSQLVNITRQLAPFVNANLQALNVVGGTLLLDGISPQTKLQALATNLNAMVQTVPLVIAYTMLMSGDDEYEKLDPAYRDTSIVMGDGWTIPLRPDLWTLIAKIIPEHLYNRYMADTEDPEKMKLAFSRGLKKALALPGPMPTGIGPVIESMMNYDFYRDRPIVGRGLESLSETPQYQFTPKTSQLSIAISNEASEIFGKTISPMYIDHLMRGVMGYTAGIIQLFTERIMSDINGIVLPEGSGLEGVSNFDREGMRKIPGTARLRSADENSRNINDFYEAREYVNKLYDTYTALDKDKSIPRKVSEKFRKDNQKALDSYQRIKNISDKLNDIRKMERAVFSDDNMSPAKKKLELKRLADERQSRLGYLVKTKYINKEDKTVRRLIEEYRRNIYDDL
jgi:hypothetical protein